MMPRQAREISESGYYHVIMRGNNKEYIFEDRLSKQIFMNQLLKICDEKLMDLLAWCIMDNHVHLVVKTSPEDLGIAFKRINIKYAIWYNKTYDKIGHVFQDRFISEAIESDEYLMMVIRYIHNNPLKANIVDSCEKYEWSSYISFTGKFIPEPMKIVMEMFQNDLKAFKDFHKLEDDKEYLEIKEDKQKFREAKIQKIIEEFCIKYNISKLENKVMTPEMKTEIIESLIGCGLSIRTISDILGAPYSSIQKQFKKIIELNEGGQKEPSLMI